MNQLREIQRKTIWRIFNALENNGNTDFKKNGEEKFINNLILNSGHDKLVIFDVGANIGNYSKKVINKAMLYEKNFEVHMFEPTKVCFKSLKDSFSVTKNIFLNNFGLSNDNTEATIYYDNEGSGLASLYDRKLSEYGIKLDRKETILLKRGVDYIRSKKIKHINLLKLDVEGHEMSVLEGFGECLNPEFVDLIQFEYGGCNIDSRIFLRDYFDFFVERGFVIAKIMPKKLEIREYNFYMENFQYSNYIAISKKIKNFNSIIK